MLSNKAERDLFVFCFVSFFSIKENNFYAGKSRTNIVRRDKVQDMYRDNNGVLYRFKLIQAFRPR